jgi:hypothetical protein
LGAAAPVTIAGDAVDGAVVSVARLNTGLTMGELTVATITGLESGVDESLGLFTTTASHSALVPFSPVTDTFGILELTSTARVSGSTVAGASDTVVIAASVGSTVLLVAGVTAVAELTQPSVLADALTQFTVSVITTADTITRISFFNQSQLSGVSGGSLEATVKRLLKGRSTNNAQKKGKSDYSVHNV